MILHSLARKTDLIFARFEGNVLDKDHYLVIQTPNNPGYHWGNYLIFDQAPQRDSLQSWKSIFMKEFPYYETVKHMTFTWDTSKPDKGEPIDFINDNFQFEEAIVLTANEVVPPKKFNTDINIKIIQSQYDWEQVISNQVSCRDEEFPESSYRCFKEKQFKNYASMTKAGLGAWFGAFIGNKLVGDLGIFHDGSIGRFQNVGTDPKFRLRGICGTLVYKAAQIAFSSFNISTLVMEADAEYHAAKIYESVGFKPTETNFSLSWWDRKA